MDMLTLSAFKSKEILCCVTDAGAGLFIAPVVKELEKSNNVDVLAAEKALLTFQQQGLETKSFKVSIDFNKIAISLLKKKYDLLLLGTNIGPSLEKELILLARTYIFLTLAFVFHFWHSCQRFADVENKLKNVFLPEHFWVIDDWIKKRMIDNHIQASKITTVSHPHLRNLRDKIDKFDKRGIRQNLSLSDEIKVITFASEPPPDDTFKWENEAPSIEDIRKAITIFVIAVNKIYERRKDFNIFIKKHPKEPKEFLQNELSNIKAPYKILEEFPPNQLMIISSAVLGLGSMFLMESLELNIPTASINFHAKMEGRNITDRIEGLVFLETEKAIERFIQQSLC